MSLVRGKLTKLARIIMSALIVIEVHSRDVVGTMVEQGVKNVNDFEWISQLRLLIILYNVLMIVRVLMLRVLTSLMMLFSGNGILVLLKGFS